MIKTDTLQITPELLSLVAEIDEFKGAWLALGTLAPERLTALRRVATIESIGSSTRIEGSKLSDRELEQLLNTIFVSSNGRLIAQNLHSLLGVQLCAERRRSRNDVTEV